MRRPRDRRTSFSPAQVSRPLESALGYLPQGRHQGHLGLRLSSTLRCLASPHLRLLSRRAPDPARCPSRSHPVPQRRLGGPATPQRHVRRRRAAVPDP
jgi:hypothetical protein